MADNRAIALLRGINVGGIRIKMADLRAAFEELGFSDVKTVLASGNVVFSTDNKIDDSLRTRIEAALSNTFGYEAWVILATPADVSAAIESFPFDEVDDRTPNVMFANSAEALSELAKLALELDDTVERVQSRDRVLFWDVKKGMSTESAFSKEANKRKYKAVTTTRNLRTLRKVLKTAAG